jgi:cytochrome c oxidase subunit 3
MGDWQPLDVPEQLWFNTGLLILSSVAFEWTARARDDGETKASRLGLLAAGFFAFAFLAAQLAVWQQLNASGTTVRAARPWLLLCADRLARPASAGRAVGLGQDHRQIWSGAATLPKCA